MRSLRNLLIISAFTLTYSCDKTKKCDCVAYDSSGEKLYQVTGKKTCEDQLINNGDYCSCDCPN